MKKTISLSQMDRIVNLVERVYRDTQKTLLIEPLQILKEEREKVRNGEIIEIEII